MYDTVKLWFPGHPDVQNTSKLENVKYRVNEDDSIIVSAALGNLCVEFRESGTSVRGSLAKFYFGHNVDTLIRPVVKDALDEICDAINRNVADAIVTRIDFAENYELSSDLSDVFGALGDKSGWRKSELRQSGEGFSYRAVSFPRRELLFYRKKPELKSKREDPDLIARVSDNMLRIELRITSGIAKYLALDGEKVKAVQLYDTAFFSRLVRAHEGEYRKVQKRKVLRITQTDQKLTPRRLQKELAAIGLQVRGFSNIFAALRSARKEGTIKDTQFYKLGASIRDLEQEDSFFEERDCIAELDRMVREKAEFHLSQ